MSNTSWLPSDFNFTVLPVLAAVETPLTCTGGFDAQAPSAAVLVFLHCSTHRGGTVGSIALSSSLSLRTPQEDTNLPQSSGTAQPSLNCFFRWLAPQVALQCWRPRAPFEEPSRNSCSSKTRPRPFWEKEQIRVGSVRLRAAVCSINAEPFAALAQATSADNS